MNKNFTEMVELAKKEQRFENIKEIRSEIDSAWVENKIINHINAFDGLFTVDEIKKGIMENDLIASKFCKDPGKQNISEKLAAKVLNANKLPAQGKNCIRFTPNGEITFKASGNSKSADFFIEGYYATQKYTKEAGGAQDNQKKDVEDFLTKGSISHKVMAIVDGDYWDNGARKELESLFANNPNVKITSVDELMETL